ncbi:hypothetical protein ACFQ1M_01610 [Sungkyunkwania multivorans]|uniref:Uncharacterized protein n=1 Tax=Sungkyunkwania multivorans TaxID=1173618 RepID=A0ABW3CTV0_9FLAO
MGNTVIDSKTDKHSFAFGAEKVSTTLTLVETAPGDFAINYDAKYSGVKSGHVQGGPIAVSGNISKKVHSNPDVDVTVSKYSKTSSKISMHVKIVVHAPFPIGKVTIFDKTLDGKYGHNALQTIVDHMTTTAKASGTYN